jgi:preprotein translocase subunit SecA
MAARTENGKKAFLVDLTKESPHEDQDQLVMVDRVQAYTADITYGTNSEFGFDYLRDNMTNRLEERVQRGHYFAIIDEADNVLIDEARTPLIISGPAHDDTEWYVQMAQIVKRLNPEDFEVSERDRTITLTELGEAHVEELLNMPLRDPDRPEDLTPEQERLMGYLEQALRAQYLFKRNKDYLVQSGKVIIVDEFTGRLMYGRRWSDGLHQAVEAKEGVKVEAENVTYATITIQNYFRMYQKLAGMTGTAITEAEEFDKIYKLEVLAIPTNLEYQALREDASLVEKEAKDEGGYKYRYYTRKEDLQSKPIFWRRKDYPDVIYRTGEAKFRAITREILTYYALGRPMLVGTTSVELSDRLSSRLKAEPLRRLAQVIVLRDAWLTKHNKEEDGRLIEELQPYNVPLEQLEVPVLRKLANEVGVSMNPEEPENVKRLSELLSLPEETRDRLVSALKAGISHQVLNARKHTEESQIIAGAGAFGAVTIATNMAGRGVDIKLGGEMAEEIVSAVNRVLKRAGYNDPYDMTMDARRQALLKMDPSEYGIYATEVQFFLQQLKDMEKVKELGGLHVIGSERHEARRIDNQLRGRAARQGDPGSSRFYLSLEDELMVRFGGEQANSLMGRMKVDDAMPIELGIVSRIVEQSQTRVEGANFDVRKHLLEYDDVLNTQRQKIYEQRNLIFVKEDLSEDVTEMLRTEVAERVPKALQAEEGPWELLSWLEQVQPPFSYDGTVYPSFTLKLLTDYLIDQVTSDDDFQPLIDIAEEAMRAEATHLLTSADNLLSQLRDRLEEQLRERQESVDTFFEGLEVADETDTRGPRELADELAALLKMPLKLTSEQTRMFRSDPDNLREQVLTQVEGLVNAQAAVRMMGAVERRIGEPLDFGGEKITVNNWDEVSEKIYKAVEDLLDRRRERFIGAKHGEGQIWKDLEAAQARERLPFTASDRETLTQAVETALDSPDDQMKFRLHNDLTGALERLEGSLSAIGRERILEAVDEAAETSPGKQKQRAIEALRETVQALEEAYRRSRILRLLMAMPIGTSTSFDKKTHQKVSRQTVRLNFIYYAARFLTGREYDEVADEVLEHLEGAQAAIRRAWGRSEWQRLANTSLAELEPRSREGLLLALADGQGTVAEESTLAELPLKLKAAAIDELGRQSLTEIYRQLLLGVITELWVEYLTQMEALRVSIGLEAYGQRDPLVQYKSKAFDLFKTLVKNMRQGVVTRMFTYRPRAGAVQAVIKRTKEDGLSGEISEQEMIAELPEEAAEDSGAEDETDEAVISQPVQRAQDPGMSKSQKRRRHRH